MRRRLRNPFVLGALALPLLPLLIIVAAVMTLLAVTNFQAGAKGCGQGAAVDPLAKTDFKAGPNDPGPGEPPQNYLPAYYAAADQPDAKLGMQLGPYVLMGIHKIESNFGRSDLPGVKESVNFLGCCKGPFQFYDNSKWSTWMSKSPVSGHTYARDADGDGKAWIYDNYDSMFAAAALLYANGAPGDWTKALWSYNHSDKYREDVMAAARQFQQSVPVNAVFDGSQDEWWMKAAAQSHREAAAGCLSAPQQLVSASDGGPYSPPLPKRSYTVTTQFWHWRDTYHHEGTDLAIAEGTPISAIGNGTVRIAGVVSGYGNYVCIDHTQSMDSCYGHLSRIDVKVGQTVTRGQQIGLVGSTGHSTGPHLHFEVHIDGAPVCPANYVGIDPEAWCDKSAPGYDTPPPASNASEPTPS